MPVLEYCLLEYCTGVLWWSIDACPGVLLEYCVLEYC